MEKFKIDNAIVRFNRSEARREKIRESTNLLIFFGALVLMVCVVIYLTLTIESRLPLSLLH